MPTPTRKHAQPTTPKSSRGHRVPTTPATLRILRDDVQRILKADDHPVSRLTQLHQKGALKALDKVEHPDDHSVTYNITVTRNISFCVNKTAMNLKIARREAAEEVITKISAYFRQHGITHKYPPGETRKSMLPTVAERFQMTLDDLNMDTLRTMNAMTERGGDNAVVLSIDIEAYEFQHDQVLEVGIAHVSLAELEKKSAIQTMHIIVSDRMYLRNGRNVPDNRDNFNFGDSVPIKVEELGMAVTYRLHHITATFSNVYFVGHSIKHDINWLQAFGIELPASFQHIDLAHAYRGWKNFSHFTNPQGMERMLQEVGIDYSNLHNGGNDANYNIQFTRELCKLVREQAKIGGLERALVAE